MTCSSGDIRKARFLTDLPRFDSLRPREQANVDQIED